MIPRADLTALSIGSATRTEFIRYDCQVGPAQGLEIAKRCVLEIGIVIADTHGRDVAVGVLDNISHALAAGLDPTDFLEKVMPERPVVSLERVPRTRWQRFLFLIRSMGT